MIAARWTVAVTPVQSPRIPSLRAISWNALNVFLYLQFCWDGSTIMRTLIKSVGQAMELPIAPDIAPEPIFIQRGVRAGSVAPSWRLIGS